MRITYIKIVLFILLISGVGSVNADVVSLKIEWEHAYDEQVDEYVLDTLNASDTIVLKDGQVARVLHFYSINHKKESSAGGVEINSVVNLSVISDKIEMLYTVNTLYGDYGFDRNKPATVFLPPVFVGPAIITLYPILHEEDDEHPEAGVGICTIEVEGEATIDKKGSSQSPAQVIADENGPVEVILESSIDMKQTWQTAEVGTYGATASKRFFRIRTERR